MKYRRLCNILAALCLVLAISASSAFAEFCFCGSTCIHGSLKPERTGAALHFHIHCTGLLCKSCNFENSMSLKLVGISAPVFKLKTFAVGVIVFNLFIYPFNSNIPVCLSPFYLCTAPLSPPVYLKDLRLRC